MSKPDPPPLVHVIGLEQKKVPAYPIPRTPYGLSFSRDGRYLAVGSHEENVIIRIDLEAGRIDRRVKAQTHLQNFVTTASGDSLMKGHVGSSQTPWEGELDAKTGKLVRDEVGSPP